ncbi:MAG: heme-binding protein [Alphaproteobacteria bacterium]|nr:heme-binding protein [Alphaproteobacteria bacterium]
MRRRGGRTTWAAALIALCAVLSFARPASAQGNVTAVPPLFLSAAEVGQIISQAVQEAQARGRPATIAVVDRVGNVLGVFRMNGAPVELRITTNRNIPAGNGLEQVETVLAALSTTLGVVNGAPTTDLSAIAKAVTGAYLSSSGNAFSTRTASQIVQENFNPLEFRAPGGPLFGVQFSQLPCSDFNRRATAAFDGADPANPLGRPGPKRSPLGLSADPGGIPLYKGGFVVGGLGVESDGIYTIDRIINDIDTSDDELIAVAGAAGFDAPVDVRANRIAVAGKTLRYIDRDRTDRNNPLASNPAAAPAFAAIDGVLGGRVGVRDYFSTGAVIVPAPALRDGTPYGDPTSGYAPDPTGEVSTFGPAIVLRDPTNLANNAFTPRAGTGPPGGLALTANESATILVNALKVAFGGRAQIRRPQNSFIQVTVSVVDVNGVILAMARTPDAPIFGTDVSLQKARTALFFSRVDAAAQLAAFNSPVASTVLVPPQPVGNNALGVPIGFYANIAQAFIQPSVFTDGTAWSTRGVGLIDRPFFPDGVDGEPHGPFSRPFQLWSPFNVGLQLDLVLDNIAQHLIFLRTGAAVETPMNCTYLPLIGPLGISQLANGMQPFAGGFPIYRNGVLIGGIGISGDGIDQDDMVGFLGLHNGGVALGTGVGHAAFAIRDDQLSPRGARLRYVNCPFQPNAGGNEQNVCRGK